MAKGITKRSVDGLKPAKRDTFLWDHEVKGFGVRCRPSGAKSYLVKYRIGRRQRWVTIGRHGSPWTPEKAKREAKRLLGLVASHHDPAADRDASKLADTVAELGKRFLEDYVASHCKPSTAYEYRRCVELFINPALGRLNTKEISPDDIAAFHHNLRHIPYQANRALGVLSKMMNLAEVWRLRPTNSNPCRHIKKYREDKRERFLSETELSSLGEALNKAEKNGSVLPSAIAAIRLLILTGARLSEILSLRWQDVDFQRSCLRLPESKTGAKVIVLNTPAREILANLPHVQGNPYVLPGNKAGAHLVDIQKPWRKLRKQAGLDDLRIHDLRHSFASFGVSAGMSLPMIGKLLGHTQPQTTARYAHLADDPVRAATEKIGATVADALIGNRTKV